MNEKPEISIGLPVFNGAKYLDAAIQSVLDQSFDEFELIIGDNCSTDESLTIAYRWADSDSRVSVLESDENLGAAPNFNRLVAVSQGRFFKWMAADDLLQHTFLEKCSQRFGDVPAAVLVYSDAIDIDQNGKKLGPIYDSAVKMALDSDDIVDRFRDLVLPNHSCISVFGLIRGDLLRRTRLIGPFVGSDRVLLVELAMQGPFSRIDEPLILHREHTDRSTRTIPRPQDRASWFDSKAGKRKVYPHWRLLGEYASIVFGSKMSIRHKTRCYLHLLRWVKWGGWRVLLDDLRS